MKKNKLLTTLAIVSVVLIAGCNCNNEERYSGWPGQNDGNPWGPGSGNGGSGTGQLAPGAVDLGLAGNFVILSKAGITDVPLSDITGNIGTSPITGAAITGVTCPEVTGTIYTVDAYGPACRVIAPVMLTTAVLNMQAAYTAASLRTATSAATTDVGAGTLNELTPPLAPGVYEWGSNLNITMDITLNGSATDVWIFNVNGTLDLAVGKSILLTGGALAQNIFWRVSGAVTLLTDSHFEGTILAMENIAMQNGASINGRLLAQTAVTLDQNTVTQSLGGTQPGHDGDHGNGNGCKDKDDHGNHNGWKDKDDHGNGNGCKDKDDNGNHNGKDKKDDHNAYKDKDDNGNHNGKDKKDDHGRN